jgi:hypothetical protein
MNYLYAKSLHDRQLISAAQLITLPNITYEIGSPWSRAMTMSCRCHELSLGSLWVVAGMVLAHYELSLVRFWLAISWALSSRAMSCRCYGLRRYELSQIWVGPAMSSRYYELGAMKSRYD